MPTIDDIYAPPPLMQDIYLIVEMAGHASAESGDHSSAATLALIDDQIRNVCGQIRTTHENCAECSHEIRVNLLAYGAGSSWEEPTPLSEFRWCGSLPLGRPDLSKVLTTLRERLDIAYSDLITAVPVPIFIYISQGKSTSDYQSALDKLFSHRAYRRGMKIAFGIPCPDGYDREVLAKLTGTEESVLDFDQMDLCLRIIYPLLHTLNTPLISRPDYIVAEHPLPPQPVCTLQLPYRSMELNAGETDLALCQLMTCNPADAQAPALRLQCAETPSPTVQVTNLTDHRFSLTRQVRTFSLAGLEPDSSERYAFDEKHPISITTESYPGLAAFDLRISVNENTLTYIPRNVDLAKIELTLHPGETLTLHNGDQLDLVCTGQRVLTCLMPTAFDDDEW